MRFAICRIRFTRNSGKSGHPWNVTEILRQAGLIAWDFEYLIPDSIVPQPTHVIPYGVVSHRVSLNPDRPTATDGIMAAGKTRKHILSRKRLLEREVGALRFVAEEKDPEVLARIHQWKNERFGRFFDWGLDALKRIDGTKEEGFSGVVSTLYAADTLVAAHYGIRGAGQ